MRKAVLSLIMIILVSKGVFAETISLEQARMFALANSRSLAQYDMQIRGSILSERSQLYSMLPSLSAGYNVSMNYLDKNWGFVNPADTLTAGATFSIKQIIFEGGKSFIEKAIRAISTESVRKSALAEYFNVLDSVDNAYYAVLEAAANLEAAESSLQTAALSLSMAEIRQASGMINQGDYLRALADKEARENSRNQARRSLALSLMRLNALTGHAETVELKEIDFSVYEDVIRRLAGISDEDADILYDDFLKTLLITNPSLARSALNSQIAEKRLSIAKRDSSPTISATITAAGPIYSSANGFSGPGSSGSVSITGSIPIDFWVLADSIERSKISRDSAVLDYTGAVSSLETDLHSALINAFAQAESVLSSRRSLEYTEKHFQYVMERYRLSQSSVSDIGDASSLLITSRNNLIRAQYGFLQSLSKIRSLGAFDDEEKLVEILLGI